MVYRGPTFYEIRAWWPFAGRGFLNTLYQEKPETELLTSRSVQLVYTILSQSLPGKPWFHLLTKRAETGPIQPALHNLYILHKTDLTGNLDRLLL